MQYGSKTFTENDKTEIAISYKTARDRNDQIKVLSELYACDKASIISVLEEKGLMEIKEEKTVQIKPKKRAERTTWTDEMDNILINRSLAGVRQQEIADELGVSKNAVVGRVHKLKYKIQDLKSKGIEALPDPNVQSTTVLGKPLIIDELADLNAKNSKLLGVIGECLVVIDDLKTLLYNVYDNKTQSDIYRNGLKIGKKLHEVDQFIERLDEIVL